MESEAAPDVPQVSPNIRLVIGMLYVCTRARLTLSPPPLRLLVMVYTDSGKNTACTYLVIANVCLIAMCT